ncbi:MAG: hypothetical protein KDK91_28730 [Gammaproteobacteria bacterium]|nr:hypothetical protein [Gammaproteobacteria bacterium]
MGTWGLAPFENDDALDWSWALSEGEGGTLDQALQSTEDWKREAASATIAGCFDSALELPPELDLWLDDQPTPTPDQIAAARKIAKQALSVARKSTTPGLDQDEQALRCWQQVIEALAPNRKRIKRLASAPIGNRADDADEPSDYDCAFCAQSIAMGELLRLEVNKRNHHPCVIYAHEGCLRDALGGQAMLVLVPMPGSG